MSEEQCLNESMPYRVRYFHFRMTDAFGNTQPFGGFTVGWSQMSPDSVAMTVARVLPEDRYIKRIGRDVVDQNFRCNHKVERFSKKEIFRRLGLNLVMKGESLEKLTLDDISLKFLSNAVGSIAREGIAAKYM